MLPPDPKLVQRRPLLHALTQPAGLCDAIMLIASLFFLLASVLFLPYYSNAVNFEITRLVMFVGTVAFAIATPFYAFAAASRMEAVINMLFAVGTVLLCVGIMYLRTSDEHPQAPLTPNETSVVQVLVFTHDNFHGGRTGAILYLAGCAVWLTGALLMVVHTACRPCEMTYEAFSLWLRVTCNFLACVLFLVGSVLDLSNGDDEVHDWEAAAWLYLIGSVMWCCATFTPYVDQLMRTYSLPDNPELPFAGKASSEGTSTLTSNLVSGKGDGGAGGDRLSYSTFSAPGYLCAQ